MRVLGGGEELVLRGVVDRYNQQHTVVDHAMQIEPGFNSWLHLSLHVCRQATMD